MEKLSLLEVAQSIRDKKTSCKEVASFYLKRIEKINPKINAVITINEDILHQAEQVDKKGTFDRPLEGVPILVKDMFCTQGMKTTAGSKILENFIPPEDATVIKKLKQAGALILGKCNQDEFAMGNTNQNSFFGACKNPWNLEHTPGGSSGGSSAAVAASFTPLALGTDTGGSVRQPSHFCNLVGVKPTYGRISRYGIIAYASSLDQAGPLTKKVQDSALVLNLISGEDEKDSTSSFQEVPLWHQNLNEDIKDYKIGWMVNQFEKELSSLVQESLNTTKKTFQKNQIHSVELPLVKYASQTYYLISSSEASSNLARYDGVRYGYRSQKPIKDLIDFYSQTRGEGFGSEVKRRIMMGTFCLSQGYYEAYFEKAQKVRRLIQNQLLDLLKKVDVLILPTTLDIPPRLDQNIEGEINHYTADTLTVLSNLSGCPSLSVPVGIFNGFPLGVQIIGAPFEEQKILNVAFFLEKTLQAYKHQAPTRFFQ